jgi:hypothetical protein
MCMHRWRSSVSQAAAAELPRSGLTNEETMLYGSLRAALKDRLEHEFLPAIRVQGALIRWHQRSP